MSDDNVFLRIDNAYKIIADKPFVKTKEVSGGGARYKFIPVGQILDVVRKAHAECGVKVFFGAPIYDAENNDYRTTYVKKYDGRESTWVSAVGRIPVTIYGRDATDRIDLVVPFEAQDNSDKVTNKIITNAERTLYRTLYSIDESEGSDPEEINVSIDGFARADKKSEPKKPAVPDPFIKKKDPKDDFITADKVAAASKPETKDELITHLNVMTSHPKTKDTILKFKQAKNAKTIYDLTDDDKRELYDIVSAMTEGS